MAHNKQREDKWNTGIVCPREFVENELYTWSVPWRDKDPNYTYKRFKIIIDNAQGKICDIGCNAGGLTVQYESEDITAVDYIPIHLKRAKVDCADKKEYIEWVCASGYNLPFPDEIFDCVAMSEMLEHIPNPATLFKEAYRICKVGGSLIMVNQNKPDNKYRPDWVRENLNPCNVDDLTKFISTLKPQSIYTEKLSSENDWLSGYFVKVIK